MIKSMVRVWAVAAMAVVAAGALSCGGDDDGGGGMTMTECAPTNRFSCVGSNGCAGMQLCNPDGTWGSCNCGASGGQSGSGSSVGQSGRGGPGRAGDGGNGGESGAAGASEAGASGGAGDGAGGAAGDGSGGGAAGDPGSAGQSGQGGAGAGGSNAGADEDCDNGEDDDGDGDVDCADDDCGERVCAREAPDGWLGPAVLFEGDVPDDCPKAYDDELARGGLTASADDADCDTCTCSPASPDCAANLRFSVGANSACGGTVCETTLSEPTVGTSCVSWSPSCLSGLPTAYLETQLGSGAESCSPSAQTPSLPDPEWDDPMLACGADGLERNGCAAGRVCAPPLPKGAALCIVRSGDRDCPSGAYSDRTVYYTDFDDNRSCTACECDQDCDYAWHVYQPTDTTCVMSPQLTLSGEDQCVPVTPTSDAIRIGVSIDGTGACDASGGEPRGSVAEDGAVTVCCDR